jgi:A/G-specific adenine glycosylase
MHEELIERLKSWFAQTKRPLPWRENVTPYRVWISEVMLQQTQAAVVIPYFLKWMEKFPDIKTLAQAPFEEVLKCWEGLGYYSRARALHKGAQTLFQEFGSRLPNSEEALLKIQGIGPYTAGAILNFAFHQPTPALDGNVMRVLSRFWGEEREVDMPKVQKEMREAVAAFLPKNEGWIVSEALIELGALVCQRRARCSDCPLKSACCAYRDQRQEELPKKRPRAKAVLLKRSVAVISFQDLFFVQKGEKGKVMQDLYQFPFLDLVLTCPEELTTAFSQSLGLPLEYRAELLNQHHTFTKYRVELYPHALKVKENTDLEGEWYSIEKLRQLPFSSGHKRILENATTVI